VDLTGIYFSNGLEFTAVPGLQNWLPPGASVVVVENVAAFTYRYGTTFTIFGEYDGELDDGGEHIVLNDKTGAVIADFRYDDVSPWPVSADNGYSLAFDAGDQNLPGSWRASLDPGGTMADTYARWVRRYFPNSDVPFQTMSQDDDGDGLNNLGEYAFGADPGIPGGINHPAADPLQGNQPGISIVRRSGALDLAWKLESSTDNQNWTSSNAVPGKFIVRPDHTEIATWYADSGSGGRLFLRVKVSLP
jgi:hypothetical protein